jgi:hypothetical protein
MRTFTIALFASALAGCAGDFVSAGPGDDDGADEVDAGDVGPDADPEQAAIAFFTAEVKPILAGNCGACHAGSPAGPNFMSGPDERASLLAYPNMVIAGDADASRLYAYGKSAQHSGPDFNAEQAAIVKTWIDMEPAGEPVPPGGNGPKIAPFSPTAGANTVDLSPLGADAVGATMTFNAMPLQTGGTYLTQLKVKTGATGVRLEHPLFVTYCPDAAADPVDSFYGLDLRIAPATEATVGGGTVVLVNLQATCKVSVVFKTFAKDEGGGGGGPLGGGCTAVGDFTNSARQPLSQRCGNCHAGGQAGATNAWDLTGVNDLGATAQAKACAQTRGKVNLANEAMSILFQRVAPGQATGHPLTLNQADFTAFQNAVNGWATKEQ